MSVDVTHVFQSAIPDALDPTIVKPSHWNQLHTIRAAGPAVLGLPGAGLGTVAEITPVGATPLLLFWTGAGIQWGAVAIAIPDDSVTFSKIQNINTDRLIGRDTAGVGDPEEIALDSTLEFTGTQAIRRAALTGDVAAAAGSNSTTIQANAVTTGKIADANVTYAKIQNGVGLSVLGRAANSVGVNADIVAGSDGHVLRRNGAALEWNLVNTANIADDAVTFGKIQNINTDRLLGRDTAAAGDPEEISVGNGLEFTGGPGIGIANDGVTFAKIQNIASDRLIGRDTAASGDPEEIALDSTLEFTGSQVIRRAALTGAIVASAGSNATTTNVDIAVSIGDGTSVISTGVKGYLPLRIAGTITGWTLIANASGSIVIDVWKDTYANAPPDNADSIAGSEKPTLSSAQKNQDLSLSTWTTGISVGDVLAFEVESATTVAQVTLVLHVTKNG